MDPLLIDTALGEYLAVGYANYLAFAIGEFHIPTDVGFLPLAVRADFTQRSWISPVLPHGFFPRPTPRISKLRSNTLQFAAHYAKLYL